MKPLLWSGLQAFVCSVVLTPIVRDIFRSFKVVDQPDQNRKVHKYPIPRVGGIAIAIAYVLTFFLLTPTSGEHRELSLIRDLLPAGFVIFITGVIDDFFGLKPWQKLGGQVVGAGLACWAGVVMQSAGGVEFPTYFAIPATIFWLLLCSNAVNLVDGLDGLAAGVGFFSTLTIFAAALITNNEPLAFATLPLAGALLGFLCFNFNPATVFLGDSGSLLIGFLLGCFGILWTQKSLTLFGITAPLMTLSIPLLDVLLAIMRRWLRNQPIFSADRGHIHHRLLDRGLTTRQTVLLLYGFCGLCAVFSLTQSVLNDIRLSALLVLAFVAVAWLGVHYLGYGEFVLAGQLLRSGEFQRSVNAKLYLSRFEEKLSSAATLADCWDVMVSFRETFGFAAMRMQVGALKFEDWDPAVVGSDYWSIHIPLPSNSHIELTRTVACDVLPSAAVPFIDCLTVCMAARLNPPQSTTETVPVVAVPPGS